MSRHLATLILLVFAISCGCSTVANIAVKGPIGPQAPLTIGEPPNDVTIAFERFYRPSSENPEFYHERAEFVISNNTQYSVWFTGYGLESPIYEIEFQENDEWLSNESGWCGTGLGRQELLPGEHTRFSVPEGLVSGKTMRVGVAFSYRSEYDPQLIQTHWNEPIDFPDSEQSEFNALKTRESIFSDS